MGTFHRHNGFYTVQTVKTSLSLIYKLVSSWGPKNVPTRTRILDIAILVGTFCPHNVGFTRPHTHTQLCFHVLWGLSIDVMFFILYKLYILSPYTAPIPKPTHHRRHSAILHFKKHHLV